MDSANYLPFCICMRKYIYDGAVASFGKIVSPKWAGTTYAETEDRARVNLTYQYKKTHGLTAATKINLPGKIKEV